MLRLMLTFSVVSVFAANTAALVAAAPPKSQQEGVATERERELPRFSRPEDRGPDISHRPTSSLVAMLEHSTDRVLCRKAAGVLGDRSIAGTLELTAREERAIADAVQRYLHICKSEDANERSEGRLQIYRLWLSAVPQLLDALSDDELCAAETAARSLALMADEGTVEAITVVAKLTDNSRTRKMARLALIQMAHEVKLPIPGRKRSYQQEDKAFYEKVVAPRLRDIEALEPLKKD